MNCIKTGAYVHFMNYGYACPADIFEVADAYIIKWNTNGQSYEDIGFPKAVSHQVTLPVSAWHREDLGVTVVPKAYVKTL